jgi:hypothetical protein
MQKQPSEHPNYMELWAWCEERVKQSSKLLISLWNFLYGYSNSTFNFISPSSLFSLCLWALYADKILCPALLRAITFLELLFQFSNPFHYVWKNVYPSLKTLLSHYLLYANTLIPWTKANHSLQHDLIIGDLYHYYYTFHPWHNLSIFSFISPTRLVNLEGQRPHPSHLQYLMVPESWDQEINSSPNYPKNFLNFHP